MTDQPIDVPSQAVAVRDTNTAVGQALSLREIIDQVKLIQAVMREVMTEGEHYGVIPGCGNKKTLLQPGAQKLTMTFRLAPEYQLQETDLPRGHKEYRVICTLKNMGNGAFVGQGVGCCSTMESKYRYRGGARKCPHCHKEAIIKGKAEFGGGWLCFAKKGGCGEKWPDGDQAIEGQSVDKVEIEDPADFFNTVLKMAKKRAFVDATITATAASDIFTQDIGDDEGEPPAKSPPPVKKPAPTPPAAPKTATVVAAAKPATTAEVLPPKEASAVTRTWALGQLRAQFPDDVLLPYFVEHSFILPENEKLEDWSLGLVPTSRPACTELIAKVGEWQRKTLPSKSGMEAGDEWFWEIVVPVPHKGQKRDEYLKNPDTIRSLYDARHENEEARARLFGFLSYYEPKGWTNREGKEMPPNATDLKFREALDAFGVWFQDAHPEEQRD
jgi:hypothetical protein